MECYYCTDADFIKGIMTLNRHYLMFDPIECEENKKLSKSILNYQVCLDLNDIKECEMVSYDNRVHYEIQN